MSDSDIVLVAGATGNTGSGVAHALLERGRRVRALVRDTEKAAGLGERGAEVVQVDLDRPATLSGELFDGVSKAYVVTWNGPTAHAQSVALVEAMAASGSPIHVVRLSAFGAPQSRIIADLRRVEAHLKASGLAWTLLKPTFFMQNVLAAVPTIRDQGTIYYDWGDGRAGMIDLRDIVDCATAVLCDDVAGIQGEEVILTGPASIGFADVAATLTLVTGRRIEYVPVAHEAAVAAMAGMGVPQWIAEGYAELSEGFAAGFADTTTDGVQRLSGHAPRDFESFARDFADAFTSAPAVNA